MVWVSIECGSLILQVIESVVDDPALPEVIKPVHICFEHHLDHICIYYSFNFYVFYLYSRVLFILVTHLININMN